MRKKGQLKKKTKKNSPISLVTPNLAGSGEAAAHGPSWEWTRAWRTHGSRWIWFSWCGARILKPFVCETFHSYIWTHVFCKHSILCTIHNGCAKGTISIHQFLCVFFSPVRVWRNGCITLFFASQDQQLWNNPEQNKEQLRKIIERVSILSSCHGEEWLKWKRNPDKITGKLWIREERY